MGPIVDFSHRAKQTMKKSLLIEKSKTVLYCPLTIVQPKYKKAFCYAYNNITLYLWYLLLSLVDLLYIYFLL